MIVSSECRVSEVNENEREKERERERTRTTRSCVWSMRKRKVFKERVSMIHQVHS